MNSKEALEELLYYANLNFERENERKTEFANKIEQIGISDNEENFKIIKKDLDRLEKLEKVIDFLKLNFNISLDSKLRISDDSECVQTFITYLPENTTIDEMFKALKEVLENEQTRKKVG